MGEKLKLLREMHNYTQDFVASVLDVSMNTYSLMEKGHAKYTIDRIEKLAELYKMDIGDFLKLNGETVIQNITNSNGVAYKNLTYQSSELRNEERDLFQQTIARLENMVDLIQKEKEFLYSQIAQLNKTIEIFSSRIKV